jgi:hypothetical protein
MRIAIRLSTWFNIIESDLWANLKYENGIDGGLEGMLNPKGMLGKVQSSETRLLQSKSKTGANNPNFGKTYTIEERKKFGRVGENHHMFNKKHSIDTRQKMCDNHADMSGKNNPMFNRNHTDATKEKMSVPKNKVCRIMDKKEMGVNQFTRWCNNSSYEGALHETHST